MRAFLAALIFCLCAGMATSVDARVRHHHRHYVAERPHARRSLGADPRPGAWCGWYMRHLLGVADSAYNLARNWAHYGRPAGGPGIGVIVVWPHHVGRIAGHGRGGRWLVTSGNDGHAVRTRERSLAGAIAFRVGTTQVYVPDKGAWGFF